MRIVPIFFAKKMRYGQEVSECDHTNTCEKLRNKQHCDFKVHATTLKNDEMLSPRIARTSVKLLNTTTTFDSRSMSASSASKCLWLKWTSTQDNISKNTTAQTRTYFARADSLEGEDTRGWSTRRTNRRWKEERRNTLFVVPTNPNRAQVLPLSQAACMAIAWYKSNPAHGLSSKLTNILISLACQRTNYRCQWQSARRIQSHNLMHHWHREFGNDTWTQQADSSTTHWKRHQKVTETHNISCVTSNSPWRLGSIMINDNDSVKSSYVPFKYQSAHEMWNYKISRNAHVRENQMEIGE